MTVVATIDVPADEFVFAAVATLDPDTRIEFEPVVPIGSTSISPLWVAGPSVDAIDGALGANADVESFQIVRTVGERVLVHVEWTDEGGGFSELVRANEVAVLAVTCRAGSCTVRLRFTGHDALTTFYKACADRGITLDLRQVQRLDEADRPIDSNLTTAQYEALRVALEEGYFSIPREMTLRELADELDVSDTATSHRLRRGLVRLLEATLPFSKQFEYNRSDGYRSPPDQRRDEERYRE